MTKRKNPRADFKPSEPPKVVPAATEPSPTDTRSATAADAATSNATAPAAASTSVPPAASPAAGPSPTSPQRPRIGAALRLPAAILLAVGAVIYLLLPDKPPADKGPPQQEPEIVKPAGEHRLAIVPGTPLEKKLQAVAVEQRQTSAPLLTVPGAVVARLAAASLQDAKVEGRWDFADPDLSGTYADWLKARNDVPFYEKQRDDIARLDQATVATKKEFAERLEKLVSTGTDPLKDLVAAKADLLQSQIQAEKDKHEAQTAIDNAKRDLATSERKLFQSGVDPQLLLHSTTTVVIVKAEVPEARVSLAQPSEPCTAKFYAFPKLQFSGIVGSLSPSIAKDTRTLRVFFQVSDPKGLLRPGMFASEVGLSTRPRTTLMVPADGVLHVGLFDYVLVADGPHHWKVTKVATSEQIGRDLEILDGLHAGEEVIGPGAILLKPYVVNDLQAAADAAAAGHSPSPGEPTNGQLSGSAPR